MLTCLHAETDEFLAEMDEDFEALQSTVYVLQQQLKDAKEQIAQLQHDNQQLRAHSGSDATSAHPQRGADVSMDTDDGDNAAIRTREQHANSNSEAKRSHARTSDVSSAVSHRKELRQTNSSLDDDDVTSPEQFVANGYSAENESDDEAPPRKVRKQYDDFDAKRRTADASRRDVDAHAVTHRNGTATDSYDSS